MKDEIARNPWMAAALAGCLAIAGFVLVWMFDVNATIARYQEHVRPELDATIATIQADIKEIRSDRETQAKHWRLHGWAKQHINTLRAKHELEPVDWPDMN